MPGFTTHYIIGQEGFYNLPDCRLKEIIGRNPSVYHLGAQGPDLFFIMLSCSVTGAIKISASRCTNSI